MSAPSPPTLTKCPRCGSPDLTIVATNGNGPTYTCPGGCNVAEWTPPATPPPLQLAIDRPLQDRLDDARIDLVAYSEGGLPEREWLPCSERMLARGGRHHVAAPLKSGKSLGMLAHSVDMAIAGARVAIVDRENGADEYARRLHDLSLIHI